jgi:ribosomal protein S18 acetylase RimI-like enzyme
VIRAALDADAAAIAEIEARTWRWAYEDFVPAEAMPIATERVPAWREHIAGGGVRVFDQDGTVVGYAAVREAKLAALYVEPAAQGAGVGSRLLADAQARLRTAGHVRAWLYVFADNAQGCAFYERHGWTPVGELVGEDHWHAPGRRYERDL